MCAQFLCSYCTTRKENETEKIQTTSESEDEAMPILELQVLLQAVSEG